MLNSIWRECIQQAVHAGSLYLNTTISVINYPGITTLTSLVEMKRIKRSVIFRNQKIVGLENRFFLSRFEQSFGSFLFIRFRFFSFLDTMKFFPEKKKSLLNSTFGEDAEVDQTNHDLKFLNLSLTKLHVPNIFEALYLMNK